MQRQQMWHKLKPNLTNNLTREFKVYQSYASYKNVNYRIIKLLTKNPKLVFRKYAPDNLKRAFWSEIETNFLY